MRAVLDTSAILEGFEPDPPSEYAVPPSVVGEITKGRAAQRLQVLLSAGMVIVAPTAETRAMVVQEASELGETDRLASTDIDVIALAIDLGVPVVTDDYSVQNVAARLSVEATPFKQAGITEIWNWGLRCKGCGRWYEVGTGGECPVCGSDLRSARRR